MTEKKIIDLDTDALAVVEKHGPNMAVPWVLMASFLYYHRNTNIISDGVFDALTKTIRERWSEITHPNKDVVACLVEQEGSSLFHLTEAMYPTRSRSAAMALAGLVEGNQA